MMTLNDTGARIRRLRLASGLGQVEFAALIGWSGNSPVSNLENGRAPISAQLLTEVATALRCSPEFLTRQAATPLTTQPLLRAYADAPKQAVDRQVADASLVVEAVSELGLQVIPDRIPTFHGDLADEHDIEQFALDVRAAAQLAEGEVVGNAARAAERLGCLVLPMPNELGRHLGLSVRIDATPVLCVSKASGDRSSDTVPGDRQRWTIAHELGHLAVHSHLGPPRSAAEAALFEKQAHFFAGAFLAPGDAMLEELESLGGRVTLQTLSSIKARWGIAIKALVMRFKNLGVIDADHARSLYKQISARGWNKAEPVPVGPEAAIWLPRALEKRFASSTQPLTAAAQEVGLDVSHLRRWVIWTPMESGRVLTMPERRTTTSAAADGPAASITQLRQRRR